MPKCPYCQSSLKPDPKNPGKYLCYTCRKRFPASVVLPDDNETDSPAEPDAAPQETGQHFQPDAQPAHQVDQQWQQPDQQQDAQWQQPEQQWQQPEQQWQQPEQQWQQLEQQWQQPEQQWQQPEQQWQQPEQQWQQPQQGQAGQQWQQPQQTQAGQQWQQGQQQWQQPQQFAGGSTPSGNAAQAAIAQNGGSGGLFSYLFVMPDNQKLSQIQMSYGDSLSWYRVLVGVLVFLTCLSDCISVLENLRWLMYGGHVISSLLGVIAGVALIPAFLIVRKRMALFTRGSWAELILLYAIQSLTSAIMLIFEGFYAAAGSVFGLVLSIAIIVANWIYFSKRRSYFDYENPSIGCKATGIAMRMESAFGGSSATPMGGYAMPGQQYQGAGMPQQQWQQPQQPQQWQQPQSQQQWQQFPQDQQFPQQGQQPWGGQ